MQSSVIDFEGDMEMEWKIGGKRLDQFRYDSLCPALRGGFIADKSGILKRNGRIDISLIDGCCFNRQGKHVNSEKYADGMHVRTVISGVVLNKH